MSQEHIYYLSILQSDSLFGEARSKVISRLKSFDLEQVKDAFSDSIIKFEIYCNKNDFWKWTKEHAINILTKITKRNLIDDLRKAEKERNAAKLFYSLQPKSNIDLDYIDIVFANEFMAQYLDQFPPSQARVMRAILEGKNISAIAQEFDIKKSTVLRYCSDMKQKLVPLLKNGPVSFYYNKNTNYHDNNS